VASTSGRGGRYLSLNGQARSAPALRALFSRLDPDVPAPGNPLETRNMLVERIEQWIADGKEAGRQEGEAAMLLRLLERRFGALPS